MRFEIGGGGIAVIFVSITALSGAVYWMGMQSGYAAGQENAAEAQKMAIDYPLPAPPAAQSSATAPAAPALPNPPASIASVSAPKPAPVQATTLASATKPKLPPRVAPTPIPPPVSEPITEPPPEEPPEQPVASAEPPPAPAPEVHRKPFNIEIQAAMDADNANQIVKRLAALGYQPRMLPTSINGRTWYKVEVGPYATREEAATAEAELRRRYNSAYGNGTAPAQPGNNSNEESD